MSLLPRTDPIHDLVQGNTGLTTRPFLAAFDLFRVEQLLDLFVVWGGVGRGGNEIAQELAGCISNFDLFMGHGGNLGHTRQFTHRRFYSILKKPHRVSQLAGGGTCITNENRKGAIQSPASKTTNR